MTTADLFYLQDSRSHVGNDMMFWAQGGKGYTSDLSKAQLYRRDEAISQHRARPSDVPWPKAYLDAKTRPAVDMQYVRISEALAGTGIELIKEKPAKRERLNCAGCGSFISDSGRYVEHCKRCGTDNRP